MPLLTPQSAEAPQKRRSAWTWLSGVALVVALLAGGIGYLCWTPTPIQVGRYALVGPMLGSGLRRRATAGPRINPRNYVVVLAASMVDSTPPPQRLAEVGDWALYEDPHGLLVNVAIFAR